MTYRLSNQDDPDRTLGLTIPTWHGILEMAEDNGWNPMGTIIPGWETGNLWYSEASFNDPDARRGIYWSKIFRLVVLEDALNLADSLEQALLAYEPEYIPSLNYYRLFGDNQTHNGGQPSLGAINAVIDLCQLGAFSIERF